MRKLTLTALTALFATMLVLAALTPAAVAKGGNPGRVVATGTCSASSSAKLKAKADDGRLETEFEVDQNRVGKRWRVTITRNGAPVFIGTRTTLAPSGSFSVRRLLAGTSARIVAKATSVGSGETCRATLSL